jgi:hypothetical protein
LANVPAPLTFKDMTDNDMRYLKSVLDINPSPESVVNPPTPSPSTPTFTPRPDAPATPIGPSAPSAPTPTPAAPATSTAEKTYVQPTPTPPPQPAAPTPAAPPAAKEMYSWMDDTAGMEGQMPVQRSAPADEPVAWQQDTGGMDGSSYQTVVGTRAERDRAMGISDPNEVSWGGSQNAAGGYIRKAVGGLASIAGGEFMEDGSFVVDARTVSELGNGSSNAGLELLMQLGGRPVEGPGDGVSDSVPATIDGTQDAAVARDEVIFDPQAVAAIGGGDAKRGAERLYEMMRQAEKARKQVDRGEDSGAGLKALSMAGAV